MTIKLRFTLLLSLLLGGFLLAALVLRGLERAEMSRMFASERDARARLLNHWIDATGRALPQFAADAAQAGELAPLFGPGAEAAQKKLAAGLASAGVMYFWILGANAAPQLAVSAAGAEPGGPHEICVRRPSRVGLYESDSPAEGGDRVVLRAHNDWPTHRPVLYLPTSS